MVWYIEETGDMHTHSHGVWTHSEHAHTHCHAASYVCIDRCCVFRPAFGCCTHPKAGLNIFFSRFSTFFVHFKAFLVISRLKSINSMQICLIPLAGSPERNPLTVNFLDNRLCICLNPQQWPDQINHNSS